MPDWTRPPELAAGPALVMAGVTACSDRSPDGRKDQRALRAAGENSAMLWLLRTFSVRGPTKRKGLVAVVVAVPECWRRYAGVRNCRPGVGGRQWTRVPPLLMRFGA